MTEDKPYSVERQLGLLWNHLGPAAPGTGNGQRVTVYSTSDQLISSVTDVTVTGLSVTVVAGAYRVHARVTWVQTTGAFAQAIGLTGPATSHVRIPYQDYKVGAGPGTDPFGTGILTTLPGGASTSAFAAGVDCFSDFDGVVVFTAGGTLRVVGQANGANTWTAGAYSFMDVETVGQTS